MLSGSFLLCAVGLNAADARNNRGRSIIGHTIHGDDHLGDLIGGGNLKHDGA